MDRIDVALLAEAGLSRYDFKNFVSVTKSEQTGRIVVEVREAYSGPSYVGSVTPFRTYSDGEGISLFYFDPLGD